jgi:ubiquinone/menaquinone biosynthesis C-methylase UbiE
MDPELANKIVNENIKMHERDKDIYDNINPYMTNAFAQKEFDKDIEYLVSQYKSGTVLKILDCAAGTGNITLKFLEKGHQVTAVDISQGMLDVLREKSQNLSQNENDLTLVCSDLDLYFKENKQSFDIVSYCSALHHLPYYMETVLQSTNTLKSNGHLYIVFEPVLTAKRKKRIIKLIEVLDDWSCEFLQRKRYMPNKIVKSILRRINKKIKGGNKANSEVSSMPNDVNEDLAEYYAVRGGIDDKALIDILKHNNMQIITHEYYCVQRLPFFNFLGKLFGQVNSLRLIAKKI